MHGGRGAAQALQVHLQHHGAHVWGEPHQRPARHHSTEVPRLVTAGHLRDVRVSQHLQSVFPFSGDSLLIFLDPVGSLVSTLLVGWLLVGHTFSKFVYFECCSVVMMVY